MPHSPVSLRLTECVDKRSFLYVESLVEWRLLLQMFHPLMSQFGVLEINLFTALTSHLLLLYLTKFSHTVAGGPDAVTVEWNRWNCYICSLRQCPRSSCRCANAYNPFVAKYRYDPWWEDQPWCSQLLCWCPSPLPISRTASEEGASHSWGHPCDFTHGISCAHAHRIV